ncbi:hypothetical protein [Amycolatopsis suaedae]|nr:hypothetical protein [Amycolatopsis suaedae]
MGEFRLQRQKNGRGYFGHVKVRAVPAAAPSVSWAVPPADRASLRPGVDAEFVEAALAGVRDGLGLLHGIGADVDGHAVEIVEARVYLTDLEASAVRAAGTLAVADAFGLRDRFELGFDSGWRVMPHR